MDLTPRHALALLVDGENLSRDLAPEVIRAAQRLGPVQVRRVYGNLAAIAGWEQFGFRLCPTHPGKNAADMLLCVEAMMLALRDGFGTLAIASDDRDFTYLVEQLREIGKRVEGIASEKAPDSFRNACSGFSLLRAAPAEPAPTAEPAPGPIPATLPPATKFIPTIRGHLAKSNRPDRSGTLGWIGHCLRLGHPGFDPADYGKASLEDFLRGLNFFEFETLDNGEVVIRDPNLRPAAAPQPLAVL